MLTNSPKNLPNPDSITQVTINKVIVRRIKNLGNYENEQIEAEAFVDVDQNPVVVSQCLRRWVADQLNSPLPIHQSEL